jgi:hypothetical protein
MERGRTEKDIVASGIVYHFK